jgi:class 3 adenylate cyclase
MAERLAPAGRIGMTEPIQVGCLAALSVLSCCPGVGAGLGVEDQPTFRVLPPIRLSSFPRKAVELPSVRPDNQQLSNRDRQGTCCQGDLFVMNDATVRQFLSEAIQAERQGRFADAQDKLRASLSEGPHSSLTQDARLRLGRLLTVFGGDDQEAETLLTQARQHAEQAGAAQQAAAAIHLLALLRRRQLRYDEAWKLLESSPAQSRAETPSPETGQWWHYRGLVVANQGDRANSERMLFRAHQIYQELHYQPGLAEVCDSLANLLLQHGKTRAALEFAQRSLKLKRALGDRYGEAISLGTLGRAYLLQARYDEAARCFAEDLALARELDDRRGIGLMLNQLGQVATLQNDCHAAIGHYQQSLEANPHPINAAHAHLGLAWVYLRTGQLDEAATACDRAAQQLAKVSDQGLAEALRGLNGALAWRRGEVEHGERLLEEAVAALDQQDMALDTIPYLYELRDLYQSQNHKAKTVRTMARALDLLHACGADRGVADLESWLRTVDSPSLARLALEQHFPDFLVEGILGGFRQPPNRKQPITVLFSDIRDYTTLTEGLPAEQIVELLNDWFSEATRVIRRHGGIIDKFIGDAVMALFGVPEPQDDAAARAVRAALELRDELFALNLRQRALGGREIRIGIGIDSGEVVVGFIGSHLRQSYTVIGDAVNVASRLESKTKELGCDLLISGETQRHQERFEVAETAFLGDIEVKGRKQPVAVFQVKGQLQKRG